MRERRTTRTITELGVLLVAGFLASQVGAQIVTAERQEVDRAIEQRDFVLQPDRNSVSINTLPPIGFMSIPVEDRADPNDHFGSALASGDFNGDGHPDLAIGVPDEDLGALLNAGAVNVLYGTADGTASVLSARDNQFWNAGNVELSDLHQGLRLPVESGANFGRALAAGDMTGDGYDDLAIGVPGTLLEGYPGVVVVLPGSANGLQAQGSLLYGLRRSCDPGGVRSQNFGSALAVGDFNGDGYGDLAVGEPGAVFCEQTGGRVYVFRGMYDGSNPVSDWVYSFGQDYASLPQGRLDLFSDGETGDAFGSALAVGDFDGDGFDDLAIGAPGEDSNPEVLDAGMVNVVYGSPEGLADAGNQGFQNGWYEETARYSAGVEPGDRFGSALAVGDFDGDGFDDLAIGVPNEDIGGAVDAGAIEVLYGGSAGLDGSSGQFWGVCCSLEGGYYAGDQLGSSLAAGDFDGNGYDDLAAGRPFASFGGASETGLVSVIYGYSSSGLHWGGNQLLSAPYAGVEGLLQSEGRFGWALAARHRADDSELVIGAPGQDVDFAPNAGTVAHPQSRSNGLIRGREWNQNSSD